MSLEFLTTVVEGVVFRRLRWYTVSDGKILGGIDEPGDEPRVCDYMWPKE